MEYMEMITMAIPLLAVGGAWGGAKVALNGTRERVRRLEGRDDSQDEKLEDLGKGLTRIETKQDMMIDYLKRNNQ